MSSIKPLVLGALLAAGCAGALADETPLFRYDGTEYRVEDASPTLQKLFYDLDTVYHEQRQALADQLLYETYLEAEATRRGVTTTALAEELIRVVQPTDQDTRAFYDRNQGRIGQPYELVRERIAEHLVSEQVRAQKTTLIAGIKTGRGFESLLAAPVPPPIDIATEGFPRKGAESPKVTVVEFGDYQCPLCRNAAAIMARLLEKYPDDLQVIYMDLPVNRSGVSRSVAVGAACAQAQNRFWDYHDLAYARQAQLTHASPLDFANELGLDEEDFKLCLVRTGRARVAKSEREARRLGLTSTPSVYVNGRPFASNHLERDLERLIREIVDSRAG